MRIKKFERDKKAKIERIIQSTKTLIEKNGYNIVTIRDIAKEANVSVGLIYKYFPKGKFNILQQLNTEYMNEQFKMNQHLKINFNDFPSYIREVNKKMLELHQKNDELIKAITIAALTGDNILQDIKTINTEDYMVIAQFFNKFSGINTTNHVQILTEWTLTIKSLIHYHTIFPTIIEDEETLLTMLTNISLKIWQYTP